MRFLYAYKTADGVRHEDAIDAPSRDEAFAALRVKGIRPIKVVEVRDRRSSRWLLAGALAAIVVIVVGVNQRLVPPRAGTLSVGGREESAQTELVAKPRARKQLPAALFESERIKSVFTHPSERVLARYARPGVKVEPLTAAESAAMADDFLDALEDDIYLRADDEPEVSELKRIVAGIKLEAKMLVASGRDFAGVLAYFSAQQAMEAEYRRKILDSSEDEDEKSVQLNALGL